MDLSRCTKITIGVLTAWPVLYVFVFFGFIAATIIGMSRAADGGGSHSSGPPVAFLVLMAAHLATMLLMIGLIGFYIVYLFKTDRVPQEMKALWAVVLFLGSIFAMPIFFYLCVWPDEWPKRKAESQQGAAA
jgi:hypothetical protein